MRMLGETLDTAFSWTEAQRKARETRERAEELALIDEMLLLSRKGAWESKGLNIRRSCTPRQGRVTLTIELSAGQRKKFVEVIRQQGWRGLPGVQVRIGGQDLNGGTPATSEGLVRMIEDFARQEMGVEL